jgi:transcription elongation factor SPT6
MLQVFEPTEIKARHLTEDDDLIRAQDIPERMQLSQSTLSSTSTLSLHPPLSENDLDDAATWVLTRLSAQKERDFFRADGKYFRLLGDLVQAITHALRFLFVQEFEVPYVWTHKRDYTFYFNPEDSIPQVELLSLEELWRVYSLGQKYRSLLERRSSLDALYRKLGVSDEYYENDIRRRMETVEVVADATDWLNLKYREKKKDLRDTVDDADAEAPKHKLPSRISAYEIAKKSVVSGLADVSGQLFLHPSDSSLNSVPGFWYHDVERGSKLFYWRKNTFCGRSRAQPACPCRYLCGP